MYMGESGLSEKKLNNLQKKVYLVAVSQGK